MKPAECNKIHQQEQKIFCSIDFVYLLHSVAFSMVRQVWCFTEAMGGNCLRCLLSWCPLKCSNRKWQIPHRGAGLIFNGGNGGNCLRCPWSLPWCPFKSPNRNLQIPHRGALCQGKIALPLQVQSIRPALYQGQIALPLQVWSIRPG